MRAGIISSSYGGYRHLHSLLTEAGVETARSMVTSPGESGVASALEDFCARAMVEDVGVIAVLTTERVPLLRSEWDQRVALVVYVPGSEPRETDLVFYAGSITEVAQKVAKIVGISSEDPWDCATLEWRHPSFRSRVYGLYCSGMLLGESRQILDGMGVSHNLLDLGSTRFLAGRSHPALDPSFRAETLPDIGPHDDAGAVLLDVFVGEGAHEDPSSLLAPAVGELQACRALRSEVALPVFATVIGDGSASSGLVEEQRRRLEAVGARVFTSNAHAAAAAAAIVGGVAGLAGGGAPRSTTSR